MYYNSNFGGQVQQPMPQQMPMYGQGPYPVTTTSSIDEV